MKLERPTTGGRYVRDAVTGKIAALVDPGPKTETAAPAAGEPAPQRPAKKKGD